MPQYVARNEYGFLQGQEPVRGAQGRLRGITPIYTQDARQAQVFDSTDEADLLIKQCGWNRLPWTYKPRSVAIEAQEDDIDLA